MRPTLPVFSPRRQAALVCFLLVVVTLAVYWPVRGFDFLCYDDRGYVTKNPHVVSGLTVDNVIWAFRTTEKANWHPLTWLSYMLDCQLFRVNSNWSHLINLGFHAVDALLLFWFWKRTTGALWRSAFVAALFAWHPAHVESVAWVAERKDMLSTFFGLLTLLSYAWYVQSPNWRRSALSLLFFALGLMTKPMLVTLPFVLLLLDWWPLGRWGATPNPIRRLIGEKIPFFLLAGISSFLTFFAQKHGGAMQDMAALPMGSRLGNALLSYSSYLGKLFWPVNLIIPYPYPDEFRFEPIIGAFLVLVIISMFAVYQMRRRPYLLMGWLWFLGTLVPVIGLVQVGLQAMADRYTYLPFIGLFVVVSWGLGELGGEAGVSPATPGVSPAKIQPLIAGELPGGTGETPAPLLGNWRDVTVSLCAIGVLLGCLGMTRLQLPYWKNSETLFGHTLAITPDNAVAHHNLGAFYVEEGKLDQGIDHLSKALKNGVALGGTHYDLGLAFMGKGRIEEAVEHFREAVQIEPGSAQFHQQLCVGLIRLGKIDQAEKTLQGWPADALFHCRLAEALAEHGEAEKAIGHYHEALSLEPQFADVLNNLAWLLATWHEPKFRNGTEAIKLAEQVVNLAKQTAYVGTLAAAYAEAGQFPKAIETVEKARAMAVSAGQTELATWNQKLLELYRSGQPYHEIDPSKKTARAPN